LNDHNHLVLKEDDVIGILETDDVKDMKPLNDRVLIKVVISYLFDSDVWLHSRCIGAFASIFLEFIQWLLQFSMRQLAYHFV
jgi:hypothetical protein